VFEPVAGAHGNVSFVGQINNAAVINVESFARGINPNGGRHDLAPLSSPIPPVSLRFAARSPQGHTVRVVTVDLRGDGMTLGISYSIF
jgi:hypothetical protein